MLVRRGRVLAFELTVVLTVSAFRARVNLVRALSGGLASTTSI